MSNIFNDTDDTKGHVLGALQSDGLLAHQTGIALVRYRIMK